MITLTIGATFANLDPNAIGWNKPLSWLTTEQVEELQTALNYLGYDVGSINGIVGSKTLDSWVSFKQKHYMNKDGTIGSGSLKTLIQEVAKHPYGKKRRKYTTKSETVLSILQQCHEVGLILNTQKAYVLALVEYGTSNTFKPMHDIHWMAEEWRRDNVPSYPYYGRGYVPLEWKSNYARYSEILGVDFVENPDLVLVPEHACFILCHGLRYGNFKRKIGNFINNHRTDYHNAYKCLYNGEMADRAHHIARLAQKWEERLNSVDDIRKLSKIEM